MFLSKSPSESFGIALLEAVSCGLPAFAYNLPAYQNIYKNNEVNFSKINDTNSVSKSILKTFQAKQFENKNGKKLLGKYTWEKIAKTEYDAFKKIYES
jgi:glycosyltransferase involved in cell wall biosynthesis